MGILSSLLDVGIKKDLLTTSFLLFWVASFYALTIVAFFWKDSPARTCTQTFDFNDEQSVQEFLSAFWKSVYRFQLKLCSESRFRLLGRLSLFYILILFLATLLFDPVDQPRIRGPIAFIALILWIIVNIVTDFFSWSLTKFIYAHLSGEMPNSKLSAFFVKNYVWIVSGDVAASIIFFLLCGLITNYCYILLVGGNEYFGVPVGVPNLQSENFLQEFPTNFAIMLNHFNSIDWKTFFLKYPYILFSDFNLFGKKEPGMFLIVFSTMLPSMLPGFAIFSHEFMKLWRISSTIRPAREWPHAAYALFLISYFPGWFLIPSFVLGFYGNLDYAVIALIASYLLVRHGIGQMRLVCLARQKPKVK